MIWWKLYFSQNEQNMYTKKASTKTRSHAFVYRIPERRLSTQCACSNKRIHECRVTAALLFLIQFLCLIFCWTIHHENTPICRNHSLWRDLKTLKGRWTVRLKNSCGEPSVEMKTESLFLSNLVDWQMTNWLTYTFIVLDLTMRSPLNETSVSTVGLGCNA